MTSVTALNAVALPKGMDGGSGPLRSSGPRVLLAPQTDD
jgi:hypothetical protein